MAESQKKGALTTAQIKKTQFLSQAILAPRAENEQKQRVFIESIRKDLEDLSTNLAEVDALDSEENSVSNDAAMTSNRAAKQQQFKAKLLSIENKLDSYSAGDASNNQYIKKENLKKIFADVRSDFDGLQDVSDIHERKKMRSALKHRLQMQETAQITNNDEEGAVAIPDSQPTITTISKHR